MYKRPNAFELLNHALFKRIYEENKDDFFYIDNEYVCPIT